MERPIVYEPHPVSCERRVSVLSMRSTGRLKPKMCRLKKADLLALLEAVNA